jgi:XTP/dITP diphosphohydrolase
LNAASDGGRELVVATANAGKLREIGEILADARVSLRSLAEFPDVQLPAEGDDYAANAVAKARAAARATGRPALADDSGLEVDALAGRPGPHSARYGGAGLDDAGRVALLMDEIARVGVAARGARFVCVAAVATPGGAAESARGECAGEILAAPLGAGGFGYDPIFRPHGEAGSMAQLSVQRKNQISHRAIAVRALRAAIDRALAPARFLLIRHAESVWNADGRWQGHADPPLSERGVAQSEALGRKLAGERADALLCSDLRRACQTAEILGRALGLAPRRDPRLRELDVGRWAGRTRSEIASQDPDLLRRFEEGDPAVCAGGGESRAEIRARVRAAFRSLAHEHAGERLIVVTHLGVVRALCPGAELANAEMLELCADELPAEPADVGGEE